MWALRLLWNFVPTGWPVINGMVLWCLLEVPFSTWSWLLLLLSRFSRVQLCATPQRQPTRLPCLQWEAIFGFLRHYHRLQHPLVDCLSAHHTKSFFPAQCCVLGLPTLLLKDVDASVPAPDLNRQVSGTRWGSAFLLPEPAGQWYSVRISTPPASELVGGGAFPLLLDFFFQWSPIWWRNFYFMVPGYLLGNAIKPNHFHLMKNSEGC